MFQASDFFDAVVQREVHGMSRRYFVDEVKLEQSPAAETHARLDFSRLSHHFVIISSLG